METSYLESFAFYITETEEHVQLYQNNGPDSVPTLLAKVLPSYYKSIKKTIEDRLRLGELEPHENKRVPLKRFRESSSMDWRMGKSICVLFWIHEYIRDDKELQYALQTWSHYNVVNLNYLFDMMRLDCYPDDPTSSIGGWRAAVYIALSGTTQHPKGFEGHTPQDIEDIGSMETVSASMAATGITNDSEEDDDDDDYRPR